MQKTVLAILTLLCLVVPTFGSYHDGYQQDGYTYKGGYWWRGNQAYTLSYYQTAGYWQCGVYYPGYYRNVYSYSYTYQEPKKEVSYKDEGAVELLLKAKARELADRDKAQTFANTAKMLGYDLSPNLGVQLGGGFNYGSLGGYGHYYRNYYAPSGQTLYGANQLTYGQLDLNQANLTAAQLAQSMVDASRGAVERHQAIVDSQNGGAAQVAAIKARGDVALALMQHVFNTPALKSQGFEFRIGPDASFVPKVGAMQPAAAAGLQKRGLEVLENKCAKCHSGTKKQGGFDVTSWPKLSDDQVDKIIVERLMTKDANVQMPRKESGGADTPLDIADILALKSINAK